MNDAIQQSPARKPRLFLVAALFILMFALGPLWLGEDLSGLHSLLGQVLPFGPLIVVTFFLALAAFVLLMALLAARTVAAIAVATVRFRSRAQSPGRASLGPLMLVMAFMGVWLLVMWIATPALSSFLLKAIQAISSGASSA